MRHLAAGKQKKQRGKAEQHGGEPERSFARRQYAHDQHNRDAEESAACIRTFATDLAFEEGVPAPGF